MEHISVLNFILACLAFGLSIFTFYWTSLRKKQSLYFVRTSPLWTHMQPQFALVNSGNRDILIVEIRCHFDSNDPSQGEFIPHKNINSENFDQILQAGKSVYISIEFLNNFTKKFVLEGTQENQFYYRQLNIEISWIDMNGEQFNVSSPHSKVGFDESGQIRVCRPIRQKQNLFIEDYLSKYRYKKRRLICPKYWFYLLLSN
jgi:hypothetical protein